MLSVCNRFNWIKNRIILYVLFRYSDGLVETFNAFRLVKTRKQQLHIFHNTKFASLANPHCDTTLYRVCKLAQAGKIPVKLYVSASGKASFNFHNYAISLALKIHY